MTILIQTVGGFSYAADKADIPKLNLPKCAYMDRPKDWELYEIILYWDLLRIKKGLLYLPGSKQGIGIHNVSIRARDIVSIEYTDAVEVH